MAESHLGQLLRRDGSNVLLQEGVNGPGSRGSQVIRDFPDYPSCRASVNSPKAKKAPSNTICPGVWQLFDHF